MLSVVDERFFLSQCNGISLERCILFSKSAGGFQRLRTCTHLPHVMTSTKGFLLRLLRRFFLFLDRLLLNIGSGLFWSQMLILGSRSPTGHWDGSLG